MLQQILRDMYVEPELLEALGEEQKKTLFLKMRQEQVRRWKEREDTQKHTLKENTPRTKKGNRKSVNWLLGSDGDVQVYVIGESDVDTSPRRLLSELRQNGSIRLRNTSELSRRARVDQDGVRLHLKTAEELLVSGSSLGTTGAPQEDPVYPATPSSLSDSRDDSDDSGTAEDDLKDPLEEENSGNASDDLKDPSDDETSGSASDDLGDSGIFYKSHFRSPGPSITSSKPRLEHVAQPEIDQLSIKLKTRLPESASQVEGTSKDSLSSSTSSSSPSSSSSPATAAHYGNRVAQLRRNFGVVNGNCVPMGTKPPVPTKPAHLQRLASVTAR